MKRIILLLALCAPLLSFAQGHGPSDRIFDMASVWLLIALIPVLLILWVVLILSRPKTPMKNWNHSFIDIQLSAAELYKQIQNRLREEKIPDVSFELKKYFESGILSPKRQYLKIKYRKYQINVCCALFGNGSYVSWWLVEKGPGLLSRIPILNDLFGVNPKHPSYYQLDTAYMAQSVVHTVILEAIDGMTEEKGGRMLTADERIPFETFDRNTANVR